VNLSTDQSYTIEVNELESSNKLPSLSASRIKVYQSCARKYFYQYVATERPKGDVHIAALFGTAMHEAIEKFYKHGIDMVQTFTDSFDEEVDSAFDKGVDIKMLNHNKTYLKLGKDILSSFPVDAFQPTHLEYRFSLPFPNKENPVATMNGIMDMVMVTDDGIVIVDHKTSKALPTSEELRYDPQFLIYAWACRELFGALPKKIIWNHLRDHSHMEIDLSDFDSRFSALLNDIDAILYASNYARKPLSTECTRACSFKYLCYPEKSDERDS
jgi:ATP-dependent exoDNAse (exonuclease V) beta subunit